MAIEAAQPQAVALLHLAHGLRSPAACHAFLGEEVSRLARFAPRDAIHLGPSVQRQAHHPGCRFHRSSPCADLPSASAVRRSNTLSKWRTAARTSAPV